MNKKIVGSTIGTILSSIPLVLGSISRGPDSQAILTSTTRSSGAITAPSPAVIVVVVGLTILVFFAYKKHKDRNKHYLLAMGLMWGLLIMTMVQLNRTETVTQGNTEWVGEMRDLSNSVDSAYLKDEPYYELSSPIITIASDNLLAGSSSPADYTARVLRYVNDNVRYNWDEPDDACIDGTATSILAKGTGQCDTQSIVVVSLLRKAFIPSRIVGGCIYRRDTCGKLMGFLTVEKVPLYNIVPEITPGMTYSRGVSMSRTGGLHAFPQAMLPVNGDLEWFTLEATTGEFADTDCFAYWPEIQDVKNKKQICVSENYDYANACAQNNDAVLATFGGPYTQ
jgi:transglutaminase-like putative cysteine protease